MRKRSIRVLAVSLLILIGSPSDAVNHMIAELDDWRSGRRRFVNVARQSRAAHAGQNSAHLPANRLKSTHG